MGRRWEQDPKAYEWQSPYSTFDNNPVLYDDPLGLSTEDKGKSVWNEKTKQYDYKKISDEYGPDVQHVTYEGGDYDGMIRVSSKYGGTDWFGTPKSTLHSRSSPYGNRTCVPFF
ncbi:MAG: hypothetical protein JNK50_10830 [Bacteroidia bacterium]|nr:hypothetical protein [Bacteroidia bacterium]